MTPINFHKKEKPLTSLVSMGGGAAGMQFGGGGAETTYIDDVFSTYLYVGNASAGDNVTKTINNGVDFTKGGLVWIKDRDTTYSNILYDTERGTGTSKSLTSNDNCLLYTSPSPRDGLLSRMPSSA